ncbi:selenocysteine-specific translation elongation factor|uniref:selenocysteine-specific translation elongation factor n=1 Tax=Noviherbaspirillum sp. L7-7A TaxID=2850560 RepID=UPI001C2BBDEE|nr:selenocysteine-specific translation elongation factor [Noviherbaspirillum sp. L7-7A]MBV0879182.1 selenocysteine-specific translation elongation factor [Noviherbaspirillum sp. L7-7A]
MIVATAGHVDHGKTTLIRLLTGIDTDRLPEEKQRGMSIDIGFAHADLGNGQPVGFVDVPGHERFARNMLAGVAAVDFALLVVAADDGVMPQTVEHLAVLDLLGMRDGAVALTKTDRVDASRLAGVEADIRKRLAPTGLRDAPLFPVCGIDGVGVEALRAHLARTQRTRQAEAAAPRGNFRLAVDRSFTVPGAGLVATGTVVSGSLAPGDEVVLSPAGMSLRVRAVQAHGAPVTRALSGMRCALNLAGDIRREQVSRGDWIVAVDAHAPTARIDVRLRMLAQADAPLAHWTPVQLHLGAAEQSAHVAVLEGRAIGQGQQAYAQLVPSRPLAAAYGDRFILRSQASQRVIGGGIVIDPGAGSQRVPRPARLARLRAQDCDDTAQALAALLQAAPQGITLDDFIRSRNLSPDEQAGLLQQVPTQRVQEAGGMRALDIAQWQALLDRLPAVLADWHAAHPDHLGMAEAAIVQALRAQATPTVSRAAVRSMLERGMLVRERLLLRLPSHAPQLQGEDRDLLARIEPHLRGGGLRPPIVGELAASLGMEREALLARLERIARLGYLEQVAPNRFFLPETVSGLGMIATELAGASADGYFDAAQFRNRSGIGRNLTIEVLEHLDRIGLTRYAGGRRRLVG